VFGPTSGSPMHGSMIAAVLAERVWAGMCPAGLHDEGNGMTVFLPPDGQNFHVDTPVAARVLWAAVCRVAQFIQDIEPYGTRLNRYHDWWQHDGMHVFAGELDIHDLFRLFASPRSILEAMPGDELVFIGIAPRDGRWYLRVYLAWDDDGMELVGSFDITVSADLAPRFQREVVDQGPLPMGAMEAATYYQSICS
jgi:hypothetical protein